MWSGVLFKSFRTDSLSPHHSPNPPPSLYQSSAVDLKTKEEKDAELDKRIEALRKKNEALVKRYQVRTATFNTQTHTHTQNVCLYVPFNLSHQ